MPFHLNPASPALAAALLAALACGGCRGPRALEPVLANGRPAADKADRLALAAPRGDGKVWVGNAQPSPAKLAQADGWRLGPGLPPALYAAYAKLQAAPDRTDLAGLLGGDSAGPGVTAAPASSLAPALQAAVANGANLSIGQIETGAQLNIRLDGGTLSVDNLGANGLLSAFMTGGQLAIYDLGQSNRFVVGTSFDGFVSGPGISAGILQINGGGNDNTVWISGFGGGSLTINQLGASFSFLQVDGTDNNATGHLINQAGNFQDLQVTFSSSNRATLNFFSSGTASSPFRVEIDL